MAKKTAVKEEAKADVQVKDSAKEGQDQTVQSSVPSVKGENAVAESGTGMNASDWGNGGVSAQDIIIPRILLMQPMSQKVTGGEAAFCEFRESLSNDLIGGIEAPFQIIPFHLEKVWIEFNVDDPNEKEFLQVVPITPQNQQLPYEYEYRDEDGKLCKGMRDYTMNFYVLRPEDIEIGAAIPYILSMRRSSLMAGKKLATQMYVKNTNAGKTPASTIMTVSCSKTTNDKKQTYAIMDIKPLKAAGDAYVREAFKWVSLIQQGKTKAHEESYTEEAKVDNAEARGGGVNSEGGAQPKASGPSRF
jgi:hypothetical protein